MSINYCQWPPFKVTSNELIRADDPDASWKCYKIRILDYKIYGKNKLIIIKFKTVYILNS